MNLRIMGIQKIEKLKGEAQLRIRAKSQTTQENMVGVNHLSNLLVSWIREQRSQNKIINKKIGLNLKFQQFRIPEVFQLTSKDWPSNSLIYRKKIQVSIKKRSSIIFQGSLATNRNQVT